MLILFEELMWMANPYHITLFHFYSLEKNWNSTFEKSLMWSYDTLTNTAGQYLNTLYLNTVFKYIYCIYTLYLNTFTVFIHCI